MDPIDIGVTIGWYAVAIPVVVTVIAWVGIIKTAVLVVERYVKVAHQAHAHATQ